MNRRTVAWLIAVPSLVVLWVLTALVPLPFVTYRPGVTENLLGEFEGAPVVQVSGHKVYRDDGQMRLTTIYVTGPEQHMSLWNLMTAWRDEDSAVYPRSVQYPEGTTQESDRAESQAMMLSSQDIAVANALRALDYQVKEVVQVAAVQEKTPAAGLLEPGDILVKVGDTPILNGDEVSTSVASHGAGKPLTFTVLRDDKQQEIEVTPAEVDGKPRVGIRVAPGFDLPFDVTLNMDPQIGGPSAGLMFSLAIYDTLTPGSMTGGAIIAGTGTAEQDGSVGPIGGIQQKIAAANDEGAELFFVPQDNCAEALASPHADELTLVRADTMESAVDSLETWVDDPKATLPSCSTT